MLYPTFFFFFLYHTLICGLVVERPTVNTPCIVRTKLQQCKTKYSGMSQRGGDFWLLIDKYEELGREEKYSIMYPLQCAYHFSESAKEMFTVQWAWHSQHSIPHKVHDPVFHFVTGHISIATTSRNFWKWWTVMWDKPLELSPVPGTVPYSWLIIIILTKVRRWIS